MTLPSSGTPVAPQQRKGLGGFAITVVAVAIACAVMAVIGTVMEVASPSKPTGQAVVPAPAASSPPAVTTWLPADAEASYLSALGQVDPGLVAHESRAIGRAASTCSDIREGFAGDKLAERVVTRLSGGTTTIDKRQAEQAIALMQKWVCPHWLKSRTTSPG